MTQLIHMQSGSQQADYLRKSDRAQSFVVKHSTVGQSIFGTALM